MRNTGDTVLVDVRVTDDLLGLIGVIPRLDPGQSASLFANAVGPASGQLQNVGSVEGTPANFNGVPLDLPPVRDQDAACVTTLPPPPPGDEGCTPGYWKQPRHFDSWVATGFAPGDSFEVVFGRDVFAGDPTLAQALALRGGGLNALGRHAVAALLNAAHPDVDYALTSAEVIAKFQAAVDSADPGQIQATKNEFADANEAGCPLN